MSVQTKLPPPNDPNTLYVLDFSGYVFRAYHAIPPLSNSKGEPTHAVYGVTAMMQKLVDAQRPTYFAVACDSKGKSFRHERYAEYKATRPPAPPDLSQQMERALEIVDAYAIPRFVVPAVEADDIIATLVAKAREAGLKVVIVSADKDLLQLVNDDVVMYDSMRDKVFGAPETFEKMGVRPDQVRDFLALTGDSSDNVPGVPSVGPKTAAQLLADFGDVDSIYARLGELTKKAVREKLETHRELAYLSRDLVSLKTDVPVEFDLEKLRYGGADLSKLRSLFVELEFTRLVSSLDAAVAKKGGGAGAAPVTESLASHAPLPDFAVELLPSVEALKQFVADSLPGSLDFVLALDIESSMRGALTGIGLHSSKGTRYAAVAHRYLGSDPQLSLSEVLACLKPWLEDASNKKRSTDSKRDAMILAELGITLRGVEFDTMLASYLWDPERASHALEDLIEELLGEHGSRRAQLVPSKSSFAEVDPVMAAAYVGRLAARLELVVTVLAEKLERHKLKPLLDTMELPLAQVLGELERRGVRLDSEMLRELGKKVDQDLKALEERARALAGHDFNVGSPRQLETILFDELNLPVIKKTKTARSTDADVLEELAVMHPLPAAILDHRMLAKLRSTYIEALPREVLPKTGRIHSSFRQAVAATGRLSSTEPNLQNIPIRTEVGRLIRKAFVPETGWKMLAADYSQIELRVLAHMSGDEQLVSAYRDHLDVHVRTASAVFEVPEVDVTREMRAQAKTINFAVIYGQTEFALSRNLRISRADAKRYIDTFFKQYAGVRRFMDSVVEDARRTGEVHTLLGRRRVMADLGNKNRNLRLAAERVACNTPIQGTAADIMKLAMIRVSEHIKSQQLQARMLLTVHDELVFEVPEQEVETLRALVTAAMTSAYTLSVPLEVNIGVGDSWGTAK